MSDSPTDTDRLDLIDEMSTAAADFYRFGWIMATSGNMSSRLDDETVTITATGLHKRGLEPADFVDVDLDGQPAGDEQPSMDLGVHLAIYRHLEDVHTVYHLHHLEAALCSDRDHKRGFTHFHDLKMLHALGATGDEPELNISILENHADPDQLADQIGEALADRADDHPPCINVENHGLYVWGQNPKAARRHAEACAYLFEYSWRRPMNPKQSSSISGFQT